MAGRAWVLQTQVGRRLALLFVLSALLPVGLFALLADRSVQEELDAEAVARVTRAGKDASAAVQQYLTAVESELRAEAAMLGPTARGRTLSGASTLLAAGAAPPMTVRALATVASAEARARLAEGRSVLQLHTDTPRPHLELLVPVAAGAGPPLVATRPVEIAALLAGVSGADLAPSGMQVCARMLAKSFGCVAAPDAPEGAPLGQRASTRVFLGFRFGAPDLVLDVVETAEQTRVPLERFRQLLLPVAAGAVLMAALLAQITIRRRTEPLAALRDGTERVARGDFSRPVEAVGTDEFAELAVSFNGMMGRLDREWQALEMRHEVDVAILGARSRAEVVDLVLGRIRAVVPAAYVSIHARLRTSDGGFHWQGRVLGDGRLGASLAAPTAAELDTLRTAPDGLRMPAGRGAASYAPGAGDRGRPLGMIEAFPVLVQDAVEAIVVFGAESADGLDEGTRRRAVQLAAQMAVAFASLQLVDELRALSRGALEALARTTDANSPWTAGHSVRVTAIAVALAAADEADEATREQVRQGALLHDIGKLAVPAVVLDKAGALTEAEWAAVRAHPAVGAEILRPIEAFAPLLPMVRHHHERWDGTGYPDRLAGEAIPRLARLLAVADVADALLSARPYRQGWPLDRVVEHIRAGAGMQFDPYFARLFVQRVRLGDPLLLDALRRSALPPALVETTGPSLAGVSA